MSALGENMAAGSAVTTTAAPEAAPLVGATPAARRAIAAQRAAHGPLMFVQSAGCCGGTAPMCYPRGGFLLADSDLLLGVIDGCPFYMDTRHYAAWGAPRLLLDVEPGFAEGFSLPAGDGAHFVIRTLSEPPACEAGP
jgi:uncharacterized protein (DUF779 family)